MKYSIIGAGIGGLTTGLAFEKRGIDYQVFERFTDFNEVGAGIWLSPNALQVFEYLDLLDIIKQKGNSIDRITIGRPDLSPISDNLQNFIKAKFGYSAIAIHRAELQKLLLDKLPKSRVLLGKDYKCLDTSDKNQLEIEFEDGLRTKTNFVIAADGINSKVRRQLFPESQLRYSGQTCWRGIAFTELDSQFDHRVYELWGNRIRFGFSRISAGKYYWFAVALDSANRKDDKPMIQKRLLNLFREFHVVVLQLIKSTPNEKIMRNDINDLKPLKNWYKGNVCLIGDAGHATTPNMGQGGAQAIEDAYYMSHFIHNSREESPFKAFQQKRQSKVNSIVSQSWTTGKVAHWKYGRGLRNFILKSIPKRLLNQKMVDMYQIDTF